MRHVQQRGGCRCRHRRTQTAQRLEPVEGGTEVAPPDVVAVDDPADEGLAFEPRNARGDVAANEIQTERLDRRGRQRGEGGAEVGVGCGDEDRRAALGRSEHGVRPRRGIRQRRGIHRQRLADERRLIQLHPLGTGLGQPGEQLGVHGKQVIEPAQRRVAVRRRIRRLRQRQQRHRADHDRPRGEALRPRLGDIAHEPVARKGEDRLRTDLGHEVVVVGVEPLGHLQRRQLALAARGGEVRGQPDGPIRRAEVLEALGKGADREGGVEHLVVVGEGLRDRGVLAPKTEGGEALPGFRAQLGRRRLEGRLVDAAGPEGLDGVLELAAAADARVPEDRAGGECGHGSFLHWMGTRRWSADVPAGVVIPASARTERTVSC